jgi:peptidoglycan-associated lipoprotein
MTVHYRTAIRLFRTSIFALVCVVLGACSTMQKSSTAEKTLEPPTASVSEAAKTQVPKAPAAETRARTSIPEDTTTAAALTTTRPEAATGKPAAAPQAGATGIASEDVDSAKRQLAEDQAGINKLHDEQDMANRRMDEEVTKQRAQEAAAAATGPVAAAAERPASRVAATKADDQIAVFPSNPNVANSSSSPPSVQQPLQRSVYFDFDKSAIKEEYDSMLTAHAAYLKSHPNTETEIQGNCDERGSREYNLALGARRAEAVKRALELTGADGRKLKTVSFGSEKPIALGKDEESYSKNRRADIVN